MQKTLIFAAAGLFALPSTSATAEGVDINLDGSGAQEVADRLGIDVNELRNRIDSGLDGSFPSLGLSNILTSIANLQAATNKGLTADFASGPVQYSIGVAGNVTLVEGDDQDFDDHPFLDEPIEILAPNLSIVGGINLSLIKPSWKRHTVYLNGMGYSTTIDDYKFSLANAGAHYQAKFLREYGWDKQGGTIQWGGLDLTAGLQWSKLSVSRDNPAIAAVPLETPGGDMVEVSSNGKFDLDVYTVLVPVTLSSNVDFSKFFTVFGGVGVDLQLGESDVDVAVAGDLMATNADGTETKIGTATIDIGGSTSPTIAQLRALAGAQVNLWGFRIFGQMNLDRNITTGVSFGLRYVK